MSDRHPGAALRSIPTRHSTQKLGKKYIGTHLVEAGLIAPAQVEVVLYDQQRTGMRFGEILAARGWVEQEMIDRFMAQVAQVAQFQDDAAPAANALPLHKPNPGKNAASDLQNAVLRRCRPIAESAILPTTLDDEVKWVG
mgnify:CR=1 FL=1